MENILLTVYTPTYNREEKLHTLYNSLLKQSCMEFVWLIVDDGSTDDTKKTIENWQTEAPFRIRYVYKENEGVDLAREMADELIDTPLNVSVDSDDYVTADFVERILTLWKNRKTDNLCGIIFPVKTTDGRIVDYPFPNIPFATYQEFIYKYKCGGDHTMVIRSDILKNMIKCPRFAGEKQVGETYKWIQLPQIPFIIEKEALTVKDYLPDGYSMNARKNMLKYLNGARAAALMQIKCLIYFKPKIKQYIKYIICSLFLKEKGIIKNAPNQFLAFALLPVGYLGYKIYRSRYFEED